MGDDMNAPRPPRCALAAAIPTPMDAEEIKRDGWQQYQILVVALEDARLGMIDREFVRQLGNRIYGRAENVR